MVEFSHPLRAGPGKYDELCTRAREEAGATLCVLMIAGGARGDGFSIQTTDPALLAKLPGALRILADQIEADFS